jgi:hypothetical protein
MTAPKTSNLILHPRLLRESGPYWPHVTGIVLFGLLSPPCERRTLPSTPLQVWTVVRPMLVKP